MTVTTKTLSALVFVALVGLSGCAHDYRADQTLGASVNAAIRQQAIPPKEPVRDGLASGLDGQSAKFTLDRYHKSFEQPTGVGNVYTIGVGTGGDTGGAMAK